MIDTTTKTGISALYTALAYHQAWTSHDLDQAMTYIAPDVVCHLPGGTIIGGDAFRGFLGTFSRVVTRCELLAAFGDTHCAVLFYDTDLLLGQNASAAEYLTVNGGDIVEMRMVFDRTSVDAACRANERAG